jgi:hypothetical protein
VCSSDLWFQGHLVRVPGGFIGDLV